MKYPIHEKAVATAVLNAAANSISTGAWTQALALVPKAATHVEIFNSTGATLLLSQGTPGTESANLLPYTIMPGGSGFLVPLAISAGKPLTVKAVDTGSTAGVLVMNLLG